MGKIKSWNVTLDEDVVEKARSLLEVGQKLSPVINDLLEKWIIKKELQKIGMEGSTYIKTEKIEEVKRDQKS